MARAWQVLTKCALVSSTFIELKPWGTLWVVDVVGANVSADLLGKGTIVLGLRHTFLRKSVPAECRVLELGVRRLGSQCWHCAIY